jgi:hypothetical protein
MVTEKVMVSGHSIRVAVTVIIPVILALVLLAGAFHGRMLPEPELPSPIAVLELDQEKTAPAGLLTKDGIEIGSPGHTDMLAN